MADDVNENEYGEDGLVGESRQEFVGDEDAEPTEESTVVPASEATTDSDYTVIASDGEVREPMTFTSQPTPPYYFTDKWISGEDVYVCVHERSDDESFSESDWALIEQSEAVTYVTTTQRTGEYITDFSQESIAAYIASGAKAYAVYDDGTEAEVQWSEVHDPTPEDEEFITEANEMALANNQHFWSRTTATDGAGTGSFVTDDGQDAFIAAAVAGFPDLGEASKTDTWEGDGTTKTFTLSETAGNTNYSVRVGNSSVTSGITKTTTGFTLQTAPANGTTVYAYYATTKKPWHNILMNSLGIALRTGLRNLLSITKGAVAFYDGGGNNAENVVASFGASGAQIGKSTENHTIIDARGISSYDGQGNLAPMRASYFNELRADQLTAATAYIESLTADNITAANLAANVAKVMNLTAEQLSAATAYIGTLDANQLTASNLVANVAKVANLTAEQLSAATAYIASLNASSITANQIAADHATVSSLDANYAHINNGVIDNAKISHADVNGLSANYAHVSNGVIDNAKIGHADVNGLDANYATISSLNVEKGRIDTLAANTADIDTIRANSAKVANLTAQQLEADHATIGTLDANYMHADMSNSDVAWIQNGTIKDGSITNAMINSVSANKLTAGTIDASNITVTNLNADNITTGTINGQRIGTGSLSLDKLSEDVYTESEVDGLLATMQSEIDGAIETWTGTAVPTLSNAPASDWSTNADKDKHVGDVYFVVNSQSQQNGYNYRFTKSGNTYSWQLIKDTDITNALSRLSTAEGKITTFDSDITTLKTDTGTLKTKTQSLETRMSDAEDDILDKVDTTTFNEVSDTVDQHSQSITQMSQTLSNKADNSTVTSVTNRVSKTEQDISGINTTISELSTTVESKADGSTVESVSNRLNTISNTVDGHTSQLSSITNTQTSIQGSAVKSTVQLWFTKANTTAPNKPTAHVTTNNASTANAWNLAVPTYNASYPYYYYCYEHQLLNDTYTWSAVTRDMATEESQSTSRSAASAAAAADTKAGNAASAAAAADTKAGNAAAAAATADGKAVSAQNTANKNVRESQQLWYTKANSTAPGKPTAKVTSTATTGNAWTTRVPTYNDSYKYYFYCMQYIAADGTVTWSDVIYDQATTEAQSVARAASADLTEFHQEYATFKQTTQNFESTVGETYATKTEIAESTKQYDSDTEAPLVVGDNAATAPLRLYEGAGHAEQFTTTGKNLIDELDASGTLTDSYYATIPIGFELEAGTTYTISADVYSSVTPFNMTVGCGSETVYLADIASINTQQNGRRYITFTPTEQKLANGKYLKLRAPRYGSTTTCDWSVSDLQLELGSTATDYEPYTGAAPSPSPDYPQEIKVVRGRNLLDESHLLEASGWTVSDGVYTGPTGELNAAFGSSTSGYPFDSTFDANTQYTLSLYYVPATVVTGGIVFKFYYTDGTNEDKYCTASRSYAFTSKVNSTISKICIVYANMTTASISNIQLTLGSTPLPYVPYGYLGLEAQGRNLFDKDNPIVLNGYFDTLGQIRKLTTIRTVVLPVSPNTAYALQETKFTQMSPAVFALWMYDALPVLFEEGGSGGTRKVTSSSPVTVTGGFHIEWTFLTDANTKYIAILLGSTSDSDISAILASIQLETGTTPTPYEPYYHETRAIPLPQRGWVAGLPDGTSDVLTLDNSGKVEWKLNDDEVVLDGSENATVDRASESTEWNVNVRLTNTKAVDNASIAPILCDKLIADTANRIWNAANNYGKVGINNLKFLKMTIPNVTNVSEASAYLTQNPITVLYPLATPVTEDCGYIDMPQVSEGCTISIPELEDSEISWWCKASESMANVTTAIEKRVTTAETSITQTKEQILLKANSSDVYTKQQTDGLISNEVTNRNAAITVAANGITTEVAKKTDKATIISTINQTAETVKIQASKVDITGDAVFSAINNDTGTTKISGGKIDATSITLGYSQITNPPTIPTKTSDLTNDSYYATTSQAQAYADAKDTAIAAAAKRTYVSIRATAVDYSANTATLEATLYIDGTATTTGVSYKWFMDGTEISGATSRTYSVPASNGLSHAYSCKCTATV